MPEEGSAPRPKYVWDREKLAWVESPDKTAAEDNVQPTVKKKAPGLADEEHLKDDEEELSPAYTVAEAEALQYKGLWGRIGALVVDMLLLAIFNFAIGTAFNLGERLADVGVATYLSSAIGAVYFVGLWTWRGQTLGKMVIGARVVKKDGSPIGIGRAFLRYLGYAIYFTVLSFTVGRWWYLAVAIVVAVLLYISLNREKRGLHDFLAGTVVINSRPSPMEDYEEEDYLDAEEESDALEPA